MKTAHGSNPCFALRRSAIQGRGAFATRTIRKGTRIVEYAGELISDEEADRRYDDEAMARHHTFLFAIDAKTSIDGNSRGNEARFINHSCDPNCEAIAIGRRIYIHAIVTIQPGVELTYDYRYARMGMTDEEARELYPCRCGATRCRGTILAPAPKPKAKPKPLAARRKLKAKVASGSKQ